jgi:hypothetical protein
VLAKESHIMQATYKKRHMKVLPAIPISLLLLDAIGLLHIDILQLKESSMHV